MALDWQVLNVWNQPEVQKNSMELRSERIPRVPKKIRWYRQNSKWRRKKWTGKISTVFSFQRHQYRKIFLILKLFHNHWSAPIEQPSPSWRWKQLWQWTYNFNYKALLIILLVLQVVYNFCTIDMVHVSHSGWSSIFRGRDIDWWREGCSGHVSMIFY